MDLKKWNLFPLLDNDMLCEIKMVCIFGINGANEAIFVTKTDDVYGVGANASGCLGLGHLNSTLVPQKITVLCKKGLKGLSFGSGPHVVAYTATGEVYSWGHNSSFELGTGTTVQSPSPMLVGGCLENKVVIDVACGSHHSVVLTNEGEVYTWGQYKNGQLATGTNPVQMSPRKCNSSLSGKNVIGISCGQSSTIAVTDNGEVYGWGCNAYGQLGVGNSVNQVNPCRVMALSNTLIVKVVCGYSHALALSDTGKVYAWGANTYGQLAKPSKNNVPAPEPILENIGRIIDIAANHSSHISAALTDYSRVYMWGLCRGQNVTEPTLTPFATLQEVFLSYSSPPVTFEPVIISSDRGLKVDESLKAAFDDQLTSDLTVRVEGKDIYVHKALLKIRCQHFRSMFQDHWNEDKKDVLEITEFSYPVYRAFLNYLYTDEVDLLNHEHAFELFVLASAYCEDSLKKLCEQIMRQCIDVENAAVLYSNAIMLQAKELEDFCFRFALLHMTQVVLSEGYSSLNEATAKNFMIRAAKAGAFNT